MPTTHLPSLSEWDDTDWEDWVSRGYFVPQLDFVLAEELTRERDRETKRVHSEARVRTG